MAPSRGGAGASPSRLDIGAALHDGWSAFRRAPWSFVGFEVLMLALQLVFQPLLAGVWGATQGQAVSSADWMLFLLGLAIGFGLDCFATVAVVRGCWQALAGERPSLGSLLRWDGAGWWRVAEARLALGLVLALPLVALVALALAASLVLGLVENAGVGLSRELQALPSLLVSLLVLLLLGVLVLLALYLGVNQQFLGPIALLERRGPLATLRRGRALVDPHFLLVLLLILVKSALVLLGLLSFTVGLLVARPVVMAVSMAAYRQLATAPSPEPRS